MDQAMHDVLRTWRIGDETWELGRFPRIMGIVNVTPDSFSDGGAYLDAERAIAHGLGLVDEGADLLDVGGESTRPGAAVVPADEELRRVLPVVTALVARTGVPISIDTSKSHVARTCLGAGAVILNDVTGLEGDAEMPAVCAAAGCSVIAMHARGNPRTMQDDPTYGDCVAEITDYLSGRVEALVSAGIDRERIGLDPGIGFGKTAEHNLELLSSIDRLRAIGRPLLVGHSRKRFLSKVLGREVEERTAGTIGVAVALAAQHCDMIRVHDVRATRDALLAWHEVERRTSR